MEHPGNSGSTTDATNGASSGTVGRRLRARPVVAVGSWLLVAVSFIAWLSLDAAIQGPAACELARGTSIYGEATWSWRQLGQVCTWELFDATGVEFQRGPGFSRWLFTFALVVWGGSLQLMWNSPQR